VLIVPTIAEIFVPALEPSVVYFVKVGAVAVPDPVIVIAPEVSGA